MAFQTSDFVNSKFFSITTNAKFFVVPLELYTSRAKIINPT